MVTLTWLPCAAPASSCFINASSASNHLSLSVADGCRFLPPSLAGCLDLVTAANKLEQQPDSEARKALLAEEVAAVKADQDSDIQEALDALMKQLDASAAQGSQVNVTITGGSVQGIVGADKVDVQEMNFGMPPREK